MKKKKNNKTQRKAKTTKTLQNKNILKHKLKLLSTAFMGVLALSKAQATEIRFEDEPMLKQTSSGPGATRLNELAGSTRTPTSPSITQSLTNVVSKQIEITTEGTKSVIRSSVGLFKMGLGLASFGRSGTFWSGYDEWINGTRGALQATYDGFSNALYKNDFTENHKTATRVLRVGAATTGAFFGLSPAIALAIAVSSDPIPVAAVKAVAMQTMMLPMIEGIKIFSPAWATSTTTNIGLSLLAGTTINKGPRAILSGIRTAARYAEENPKKAAFFAATAFTAGYLAYNYGLPWVYEQAVEYGKNHPRDVAVADWGSGSIKLNPVRINPVTNEPVEVLKTITADFSMTANIGKDGLLSEEAMQKAIGQLKGLLTKAKEAGFEPDQVVGVATAWARDAKNAVDFLARVQQETGIVVNPISQTMETMLGRYATEQALKSSNLPISLEQAIVGDMGGGSAQLSTTTALPWYETLLLKTMPSRVMNYFGYSTEAPGVTVWGGTVASKTFKAALERTTGATAEALKTTFEWTPDTIQQGIELARNTVTAINTAGTGDEAIRTIIERAQTGSPFVAVGNVYNGVSQLVLKRVDGLTSIPQTTEFTLDKIQALRGMFGGMTSEQISKTISPYDPLSNTLLVEGMMRSLGIQKIITVNANSGLGALSHTPYWTASTEQPSLFASLMMWPSGLFRAPAKSLSQTVTGDSTSFKAPAGAPSSGISNLENPGLELGLVSATPSSSTLSLTENIAGLNEMDQMLLSQKSLLKKTTLKKRKIVLPAGRVITPTTS
jgi:hypothetical protein